MNIEFCFSEKMTPYHIIWTTMLFGHCIGIMAPTIMCVVSKDYYVCVHVMDTIFIRVSNKIVVNVWCVCVRSRKISYA